MRTILSNYMRAIQINCYIFENRIKQLCENYIK